MRLPVVALVLSLLLSGDLQRGAGQVLGLDEAADAVAGSWSRGDVDGVAAFLMEGDLRIVIAGEDHPSLARRHVVAAISSLLKEAGRGGVSVRQARVLGGDPPRAFVDLSWRPVTPGTSEALSYTVFLGFTLSDAWKVTEIRVLGPS